MYEGIGTYIDGKPPDQYFCIQTLFRDPQEEDLHRYLTYYSPRIRQFEFEPEDATAVLSIETLQALQLVLGNQPGILSPNLRTFGWFIPACTPRLGEEFLELLDRLACSEPTAMSCYVWFVVHLALNLDLHQWLRAFRPCWSCILSGQ